MLIKVEHLVKDYQVHKNGKGFLQAVKNLVMPEYLKKRAVDDISFSIQPGEMVGFIGPNGAGKSTTVKILSGVLSPTSGRVTVGDMDPFRNRKKYVSHIGVVFGQRTQLWWDLPVEDTFDLLKAIYKIPDATFRKNLNIYRELLDLDDFMSRPVRQLSLGQRMRADIAASLLHDPEILFFDEPTIGLDIVAKEKIRECIKAMNRDKGITMLFTTHDMQDIEKTCERMIVIDRGKIICDSALTEIRSLYDHERRLTVKFAESYPSIHVAKAQIVHEEGNSKTFSFHTHEITTSELISSLMSEYVVMDLTVQETDIETIIKKLYEEGEGVQAYEGVS
ncbi:ATP-binding cassette domain-containing protein [Paenibacillus xylanexedens]|uniref:ABC transporter ATP-binding protein n=1 Tax=Paenibacillus xylanexedens TaxID=528191 RepID=UPI0021B5E4BB|nr:ATP-binding cassette domain-containing protein [Paenibacillus xylanexedens]